MFYDTLRAPPQPSTLAEAVCLLVLKHRQEVAISGARAQAQASLGGKAAQEAFQEYVNKILRVEVADRTQKQKEALESLKNIKEIRFKPMGPPAGRRKVRKVTHRPVPQGLQKHLNPVSTRPSRAPKKKR